MDPNSSRRSFLHAAAVVAAGAFAAAVPPRLAAAGAPDAPAGDLWETFRRRRSVRKFRPDPVPDADLKRMVDAARLAPCSGNQQPWKFLIVREPARIDQLREGCVALRLRQRLARGTGPETPAEFERGLRQRLAGYFSAPAYIVVLTDNQSQYPDYNHWDGPLAAGYLMLAARALGYGTVFITDVIPDAVTRSVLGIPDRYTRVCITPVGVPEAWPDSPPKRPLETFLAFERL